MTGAVAAGLVLWTLGLMWKTHRVAKRSAAVEERAAQSRRSLARAEVQMSISHSYIRQRLSAAPDECEILPGMEAALVDLLLARQAAEGDK